YDEWTVDITEAVEAFKSMDASMKQFQGNVPVSIRCDNSRDLELIPSDLSDFNLYGGIYRYLNLVYVPQLSVDKLFVTATTDAKGNEGQIQLNARFHNPNGIQHADVSVELFDPNGRLVVSQQQRVALAERSSAMEGIGVKRPVLWSPADPSLYTLRLTVIAGTDTATHAERIGFRH